MTPDPARQWRRACSLIVGADAGQGLDLEGLRITFATHKGDIETPNSATITVYNLAPATASRIGGEFSRVILSAGYEGAMGTLFDGQIRQVRRGRENGTDSWLEITAADGDRAYNHAVVSRTLAAGARPADQVGVAMGAFAAHGAKPGHVGDLGGQPLPRGKVLYGMARDVMRNVADDREASWSIQDGQVQMVPLRGYLPGEAVVLTHETGLLDAPEQTDQGIKLRCLLNPRLRIGGRVRLDNASILRARTDLKVAAFDRAAPLDSDGFYRIIRADHTGDTHGQDWFTDLLCIAIDDTMRIPVDQLGRR
ncbi:hypothetical protein [Telmatospirillum sp. J64-1]|uniref:phage protein n=1 Tax=Telmatospirillum sp. J64-1 TaxID=2502183 RepID=UPI00115C9010|nr:hypothetical protein [Telmatospirillum sp. J64-1]